MISRKDFFLALEDLETTKRIKKEVFIDALQTALAIAYKKHTGTQKAVEVKLMPASCKIKMFAYQTVVEVVENRDREISLEDARLIDKKYKVGDTITEEINSDDFDRIVAQTAKQVIMQKLHEVETEAAYSELSQKEDQLITCVVRRIEGKNVFVEINKLEAVLGQQDQLPKDRFNVGDKVKVYVKKIKAGQKGPVIVVTRTNTAFVKKLFEMEVPEIAHGIVVIKNIVRDPGYRTKLAVYSEDKDVDPVGACVGNRGVRINTIVSELEGEKVDVIPWCEDPLEFIARSLSPAKIVMVQANDEDRGVKAVVMDDMLSLAIGKDGQNARLAAKLTGWKIDIKPYSSLKDDEGSSAESDALINEIVSDDAAVDLFEEDLGDLE